jgi:hypothetical protein
MEEKIKVSMPIEIPRLKDDVDIESIKREINNYVKNIIADVNIQDLGDWNLLISANSRSTNKIGLFKRAIRYPSDKEFVISISIPIPNDDEACYGLSVVKEAFYRALDDKKFYALNPNFEEYGNLYQYILESLKRAIKLAFTQGFTCNGKKIKFK